jgi:photosystem II stability/assembly factor-like uncharacterized protein
MRHFHHYCTAAVVSTAAVLFNTRDARAQRVSDAALRPSAQVERSLAALRYRYIGPAGNRVAAVAGVTGDANVVYAGAASGGIWKTTDAGTHWTPIFEGQEVSSIGALAVAPSNPNIVWAGTGETWVRGHISAGNGVYRSTDGGKTWAHAGLDSSGRVGRIAIHPTDPNIVFVAAQGFSYGPQQERGIYRTTDGGAHWQRVLFVDPNTGGIDVVMHPADPRILFAATWQLEMHTWGWESGGPGSGIWKSTDGGDTWTRLSGHGLPAHDVGKIGLAIAHSAPNRVYALIETADGVPQDGRPADRGELWRSDDGGANWNVVSHNRALGCRQPYYTRAVVAPDNPDEIYFLCASFLRSLDGGRTSAGSGDNGGHPLASPGGDNHDLWIDPTNPDRMVVGNDLAVAISVTRGRTWHRIQLPIAQLYHVTVDNKVPYDVYGNMQDGGSLHGPSNSRTGATISRSAWHAVGGGESGWSTPDPVDPNIVWSSASGSGMVGGVVLRFDERTRQERNVEVLPLSTGGYPAKDVKYRFIWDAPLTISPHDHNRVYVGSQFVHVTTDGGQTWRLISPDLTRNDTTRMGSSGGLTPDNIGVQYGGVIYAIAESPAKSGAGVIWTGSNDGRVHLTRDGGRTWTDVSANLRGMPAWGSVRHIEPSRYDVATAYLIVDAHQENDRRPWVYRTRDFGKTWTLIIGGLPTGPLAYAHIIREDPVRQGLLYLGTESAMHVSFDAGEHWKPLQLNLPHAPVYGMVIQEPFNDLVVATYGRGFWILENLAPLQQLTTKVEAAEVHLFPPRPAYRFTTMAGNSSAPDDPSVGSNPPVGATIDYWLNARTPVTIDILDSAGTNVRTLRETNTRPGLNRARWDFRNTASPGPRLRTRPLYYPDFAMARDGTRSAPGIGSMSVLMPPGRYTIRLTANGRTVTQPLEVRRDPNQAETMADIRVSTSLLLALQQQHRVVAGVLESLESMRAELQATRARTDLPADLRTQGDSIEHKLTAIEETLIDLRLSGEGEDIVRWPIRTAGQLQYLAGRVASSDFKPTAAEREVQVLLVRRINEARAALDRVATGELAAHNAAREKHGLQRIEPVRHGIEDRS